MSNIKAVVIQQIRTLFVFVHAINNKIHILRFYFFGCDLSNRFFLEKSKLSLKSNSNIKQALPISKSVTQAANFLFTPTSRWRPTNVFAKKKERENVRLNNSQIEWIRNLCKLHLYIFTTEMLVSRTTHF